MESTKNLMTAMIPSGFGMPTCGHAFDTTAASTTGAFGADFGGTAAVVRERRIEQDTDLAIANVPGTSAWSPPTS
jgi:hypothetical protein